MAYPTYILCGGRSRRFGSDKARALLEGEPLIRRVARLAGPAADSVVAVADEAGKYDDLGLATVADHHPGEGPLAGLEAALRHRLEHFGVGWSLLLSCDLIYLNAAWVGRLEASRTPGCGAVAFREGNRWQPLLALYHTDVLPRVEQRLAEGSRAMQALLNDAALATAAAPLPEDWPVTLQANRPDDLPASS